MESALTKYPLEGIYWRRVLVCLVFKRGRSHRIRGGEDAARRLFKSTFAWILQGIISARIGIQYICTHKLHISKNEHKHTKKPCILYQSKWDRYPRLHREYSGFPGCSGRGDSGALSGVMATITSIVLIIHIGKNEMPGWINMYMSAWH